MAQIATETNQAIGHNAIIPAADHNFEYLS
jgi:hypothetical protein